MEDRNKTHGADEIAQILSSGDAMIRPINPDAQLIRRQAVARAKDPNFNAVKCPHPVHALQQMVDVPSLNSSVRDEVPVNVWVCRICKETLWLVDGSGMAAADR